MTLNLVGKTFGRLTVLERQGKQVLCQCACGNVKLVDTGNLRRGTVKSCGCGRGIPTPSGFEHATLIYRRYQKGAADRGYAFELTFEQFLEITAQPCCYCHLPNSSVFKSFVYNGIDRRENDIGYTVENCVPCCKFCNKAKDRGTAEALINWLDWVRSQG